jgi:hypothetical protein
MAYYKIQNFVEHLYSWKDVQKSYSDLTAAKAKLHKTIPSRIMLIDGKHRSPVYYNSISVPTV